MFSFSIKRLAVLPMRRRNIFIKNKDFKSCTGCAHFLEHSTNYPYDSLPNDEKYEKYGKCKMFGEQNLVSGNVEYDYATWCRQDKYKCGIHGKYFTPL